MSLYIFRSKPSTGATDLAEAVDGVRFRGRTISIDKKVKRGDTVVCWGEAFTNVPAGVRVLNGVPVKNKYDDALTLRGAGVSTIEVSRTRPAPQTQAPPPPDPAADLYAGALKIANDFSDIGENPNIDFRGQLFKTAVSEVLNRFTQLNNALLLPKPVAPPVPLVEWLGRATDHVGGGDLLHPTDWTIGYYAKKEEFVNEYRIHSFLGKSIRAGVKAPRADVQNPHPWIRSWDAGWRIKYDGVSSKKKHRELAHSAVKALGLDFGAVDIGERADGTLVVLEVNRAPGLKEGTIDVYAKAINNWIAGKETAEV